jgi:hypothetical protein
MGSLAFVRFLPFAFISISFFVAASDPKPVGCDLQLGSDRKPDACGVCGGDNSTCLVEPNSNRPHQLEWVMGQAGPCVPKCPSAASYQHAKNRNPSSTSADDDEDESDDVWPAYQMSKPFCVRVAANRRHSLQSARTDRLMVALRNLQVSEHLCDPDRKPNVQLQKCQSAYNCPAK